MERGRKLSSRFRNTSFSPFPVSPIESFPSHISSEQSLLNENTALQDMTIVRDGSPLFGDRFNPWLFRGTGSTAVQ